MRVLVTGVAGMVGSYIREVFAEWELHLTEMADFISDVMTLNFGPLVLSVASV
jgi:dTDP-4-dehydrorhamnose reductase|tara:strand:+ start:1304 stop:1462 length:159 start_codon:yes stop_codon:yes gene_type:complete